MQQQQQQQQNIGILLFLAQIGKSLHALTDTQTLERWKSRKSKNAKKKKLINRLIAKRVWSVSGASLQFAKLNANILYIVVNIVCRYVYVCMYN